MQTHGPYEADDKDPKGHEGVTDYRTRLGDAVRALTAFKAELDARGRPYALVLFGDHLPGLRMHQFHDGMKSESDPRLHQIPVLIASNTDSPQALAVLALASSIYILVYSGLVQGK